MRDKRSASALPANDPQQQRSLTSAERSLRARLAAHAMHAAHDGRETTANGRAAFLARFEREVDPGELLEPVERRRRAEQARRAYFARLSLAAAKARKAKQAGGKRPRGGAAA
jgi:hypothetical protein